MHRFPHLPGFVLSEAQPLSLGIFRSDYMIHNDPSLFESKFAIRQVEFNTMASSFGGLSARVSALHRYHLRPNLLISNTDNREGVLSKSPLIPLQSLICFGHCLFHPTRLLNQSLLGCKSPMKLTELRSPVKHYHSASCL